MNLTHASFINTHCLQMFSCAQEPPAPPSLCEAIWHNKTVDPTREETTVCIKGVPGNFFTGQPEAKDSDKALCLMDSFDARQNHPPYGPCSTVQHPPLLMLSPPIIPTRQIAKRQNVKRRSPSCLLIPIATTVLTSLRWAD